MPLVLQAWSWRKYQMDFRILDDLPSLTLAAWDVVSLASDR